MLKNQIRHGSAMLLLALAAASAALAGDWPQFLGPSRNNISSETGLLDKWPAQGPKTLWTVQAGEGFGPAAIADGKVYILDRKPGEADALRVLNLADGKELWKYEYPAAGNYSHPGSRSTPTVEGDTVYTVGSFGHVNAIDTKTRKPIWTFNLAKDYEAGKLNWGFAQSPLIHGDMVILSPTHADTPGLIALDKKSGKKLWESEAFGGDYYTSPMTHTILGVKGILMHTNDLLVFVAPETGKTIFKHKTRFCRWSIPMPTVFEDGRIFVTGGYGAGSVMYKATKTGDEFKISQSFALPKDGSQLHPAILHKGKLYVNINENDKLRRDTMVDGGLACIDPDSGKVLWRTGANPNFHRGAFILVQDKIVLLDGNNGDLILIDPSADGYKEVSRTKVFDVPARGDNKIWAPLALSNGLLVIRNQSAIKCLDLRAGKI